MFMFLLPGFTSGAVVGNSYSLLSKTDENYFKNNNLKMVGPMGIQQMRKHLLKNIY